MRNEIRPVVMVNSDRCVSCHRCIAVCPVKLCNDGSGDHVHVNHQLCLGCGRCIGACTHEARVGVDDSVAFFQALDAGEEMIAIVAPAIASSFPGLYLNLNGWLKSKGVRAVFDVSFGAELTVKSYIDVLQRENPELLIAQPCPALVTYIETYQPTLMKFLAPAHSPMAHTMAMIRHYFAQYARAKIAVISPCFATRRELDAIELGDYNVTFQSLDRYLTDRNVDLRRHTATAFDGDPAERAALFSNPGGLMRTVEREVPSVSESTRKIEGSPLVYEYLSGVADALEQGQAPLRKLVDCLSCEHGCNGGPGTLNHGKHGDEIERPIEQRSDEARRLYREPRRLLSRKKRRHELTRRVNTYWDRKLYQRAYQDRSAAYHSSIQTPTNEQLGEIYRQTHKTGTEDFLNCGSCGYDSCEQMATAIHNGLSRSENCRQYVRVELEQARTRVSEAVSEITGLSIARMQNNIGNMQTLASASDDMAASVTESSASIEQMVANIKSITQVLETNAESVVALREASEHGKAGLTESTALIEQIATESNELVQASEVIQRIAAQTDLLAVNAAIEAAHAGDYGRGFAVVADEIRKLAEESGEQAKSIGKVLKQLKKSIDTGARSSSEAKSRFDQVVELTGKVEDQELTIKAAMEEQSAGSQQVLEALTNMNELTVKVKEESDELLVTSQEVLAELRRLAVTHEEDVDRERKRSNGDGTFTTVSASS